MMTTTPHDRLRLRDRAAAVHHDTAPIQPLTARAVARCLSGTLRMLANRDGQAAVRAACADLANNDQAWALHRLHLQASREPLLVVEIATVAGGILPITTADNLRSALSFWAYEDPAAWQAVVG